MINISPATDSSLNCLSLETEFKFDLIDELNEHNGLLQINTVNSNLKIQSKRFNK